VLHETGIFFGDERYRKRGDWWVVVEKAIIIYENDKCHTKLLDHPCRVDDPQKHLLEREKWRVERERERD
jgi:hypothetical protein